jgi:hypothetical protein
VILAALRESGFPDAAVRVRAGTLSEYSATKPLA